MSNSDNNGSTQINDNLESSKNEEENDSTLKDYINIFKFSDIHPKRSITLTKLNSYNISFMNCPSHKNETFLESNKKPNAKNSKNENYTKFILKKLSFEIPSKDFLKDENLSNKFLSHYNDSFSNFCGVSKKAFCDIFVNNNFETAMNDLGEINIEVKCIIDEIKKIPKGIHSKRTKKQRKFKKMFKIKYQKNKRKGLIFRVVYGEKKPKPVIEINEETNINKEKTLNSLNNLSKNKLFGLNLKKKLTLKIPEKKNEIHFAEPIPSSNYNKEKVKSSVDLSTGTKNGYFSFNQSLQKSASEKNIVNNNGNNRDYFISPSINIKINSSKQNNNNKNNNSYKNLNLYQNINHTPFGNNFVNPFASQNNIFNFSRNITQNYLDAIEQSKKNDLLNKKRTPIPPSMYDNNIYSNNSANSNKQSISPLYIGTHSGYLSPYIMPGSNIQSPLFFNLNSPYTPSNLFRDDSNLYSCNSFNFSGFSFDRNTPISPNNGINASNNINSNMNQSLFDFLYKNKI